MAETKTKTAQKAAPKSTATAKPAAAKKTVSNAALADAPAKSTKSAKPAAKRSTTKKSASSTWNPGNEERYNMIQVAAYYLAERDNFSGSPVEYWMAAEAQIGTLLPQGAR
jgi:hypothetical protein